MEEGTTWLRTSWFATNTDGISGGVVTATKMAVLDITQSVCFRNQAKYYWWCDIHPDKYKNSYK